MSADFQNRDDTSQTAIGLYGLLQKNFIGESLWVPFVYVAPGIVFTSALDTDRGIDTRDEFFSSRFGGGVRRFLNEDVSFDVTGIGAISEGADGLELQKRFIVTLGFTAYIN